MKLMAWSEHFVTGISTVDAQHHALVDMINNVAPSLVQDADGARQVVAPLLDKLIHYAAVHFKHEEDLMTRSQVLPDYLAQHHRTHQTFVDEVLQMRQQYEQAGTLSGKDLLQFLTSWLSFHILSEDKRMASQVQAIAAGDTPSHAYDAMASVGGAPNAVYNAALIDLFSLLSERNRTLLQVNQQLLAAQSELESRVQQRTQELSQANADLQAERRALVASMEHLERTRTQLLQSEKMAAVGQLAAGVAHEINNPIGFVSSNIGSLGGYVEQLFDLTDVYRQASADLPAAQRQTIDTALKHMDFDYLRQDVTDLLQESKDGLGRVKRIVSDLRDFSQADEGELLPLDLNQVLESALNVAASDIRQKAEVVKELVALPAVLCRAAQIQQVFVNLLVNAAQALPQASPQAAHQTMAARGRITVRSGVTPGAVWAEISDNGCGMTQEVQKRIFEPFFTTHPVGQGTGLGLSLTWEIIQRHHGQIQVSSSLGQGTTVRVSLPLQSAETIA